ncbi:unnamed protein product [Prorocentrum cordatum]|uniref:Uncharacterized protein n=1 Tax=Prorocentrum cordatum TaxID=2364126 RepID=A0ABN9V179_9DINO|nr:unnamed protein product [Polarella glacialis]
MRGRRGNNHARNKKGDLAGLLAPPGPPTLAPRAARRATRGHLRNLAPPQNRSVSLYCYVARGSSKASATVSSAAALLSNRPPGRTASTRQAPGPSLPAQWSASSCS